VGQVVEFVVSQFQAAVKVVWDFGTEAVSAVKDVIGGVSDKVSASFTSVGVKTVTATFKDATDSVLGRSTTTVTVIAATMPTAIITTATADTTNPPGSIASNGGTEDTTPTLSGTISAPLTSGQNVNVYDGDVLFAQYAVVSGTNWTFTPITPLIGGSHTFTAEVVGPYGTVGARSAAYLVNVLSANLTSIAPSEIMRTLTGSFDIVGRDLPTSGLSVTVPGDPKAVCQSPSNMTANGFGVACTFYKLGAQTLEIRTPSKLVGTVSVLVKTNVTGVTWTSPSTSNSGTIKFKEDVTFKVAGVNLLADPAMGFAVQLCGVSNVETGVGSATQRTFTCNFNDAAGAVAGQMPGVIKDAPGGQVLFDGWNVPVQVPITSNLLLGAVVTDSCATCSDFSRYGNPNFLTDGDNTTGRNVGTFSGSFTFALIAPADIGRMSLLPTMSPSGNVAFEIQTSADANGAAGTWTSHGGRLTQAWKSGEWVEVALNANTTGVRVVKLFVYSSPSWVAFLEVQGSIQGSGVPVETSGVSGTGKLTDTGITASQCYEAGSNVLVSCTSAGAIALNDKQDGMVGRDVTTPDNADGKLGFSYSTVGSYDKTECVKDNITGLMWEGKTATGTRAGSVTYTNYGDGRSGDASAYVTAVNASALCGYTDWRLPTADELQGLVEYGVASPGPTMDVTWFTNTMAAQYWTASPYVGKADGVWFVNFNDGGVGCDYRYGGRSDHFQVRLVR